MAPPRKRHIQDLHRTGTLTVLPVITSIPQGKIRKIRIPELPEGYGTIGRTDVPGEKQLTIYDEVFPLFAEEDVLYQGQTIFLLYGPDEGELLRLRDGVDIEYETDYSFLGFKGYSPEQILQERFVKKGGRRKEKDTDIEIKDQFQIPLQAPPVESRLGAFCFIEKKQLKIHAVSPWPFIHRKIISEVLGLPLEDVSFRRTDGDISSDTTLWLPSLVTTFTALATWVTRQPCKMLLSLDESRIGNEDRTPATLTYSSTIDEKGKVKKREIEIDIDGGAFPLLCDEMLERLCLSALGTQKISHVEITARIIRTSAPPLDSFAGLGMSQGFFAAEMHNTHIAQRQNEDPLEQRKEHALAQGEPFIIGGDYREKTSPGELLERVAQRADFHRKYGAYQNRLRGRGEQLFPLNPRRGIGCALAYQGNGFLSLADKLEKYTLSVRLDTEGEVTILTSSIPGSPRSELVWKEVAARILQIEQEKVRLEQVDTDLVPDSGPALFSRNVTITPRLIEQCCNSIQKKRFRDPLPIEVRRTFRLPKTTQWNKEDFTGQPFLSLSWGAATVELEIDSLTFEPRIRKVWMAVNCGRTLNKPYAKNLLDASIHRALDWCTHPPRGLRLQQEGFFPENIAPPRNAPYPVEVEFIETRGVPSGGIGELADNIIPAAYASALSQAMNRRINRLPVIPGDLILEGEE